MQINPATAADVDEALACLAEAFAEDPITGFLLQTGPGYRDRVTQFFSLLMRARMALGMPVLLARDAADIQGAAMGYDTRRSAWPTDIAEAWDRFEASIPGMADRMAVYDAIAEQGKPEAPHYYLGVLGVHPALHGQGLGLRLLQSFCDLSARDPRSSCVYLETAKPDNVGFYEHAGFVQTAHGSLGEATLWCLALPHGAMR